MSLTLPAPLRSQAGFSLIELVLVIVILSILGIGFGKFLSQSVDGWRWSADQFDRSGSGRTALDRIVREVEQVPTPATSVTIMQPHTLEFDGPDGTTRTFDWSGVAGDPLTFSLGADDYQLVAAVDSVGFAYYDAAGAVTASPAALWRVGVTLITGDAAHYVRYRTAVHVRNH